MRICFLDRSTNLETIHDLETKARGGMVTSLFKVSDYLSSRGHDVWVLSDVKQAGTTNLGTKWVGLEESVDCDVLVCNRGINGFEVNAKHRILWTHDLPHAGFYPEPKNAKAFSATVFMSNYAERIWRYYYKDIGRSFLIPNGVDKEIFYSREKDLNYLIYASAPNRGLKKLPFIFDCISEIKPLVYMKAYSNLSKLHPGEEEEYEEDYELVKQSKVTLCDPIPQKELAEELGKAGLLILPSEYPEICSNVVLQSLSSGTPIISTGNLGSVGQWVSGKNGALTEWSPHDYMAYTLNIIRESVNILNDESLHRKLIKNASNTFVHSWEQVGTLWEKMLIKLT